MLNYYCYRNSRKPRKTIPAGTAFEDLPESWRYPLCNQPMMAFEEVK